MKNRIIDCLTGEITTVDATAQEIAQIEIENAKDIATIMKYNTDESLILSIKIIV